VKGVRAAWAKGDGLLSRCHRLLIARPSEAAEKEGKPIS
jgi:hypothetical protein